MERQRQIETFCAEAILKAVSSRYAPGTDERVLQFLADRGAVPILVDRYHITGDLDKLCLEYWNSMLEPDALRLEDLVSALLISFATSFAASVLIEAGRAGFPALFRRIARGEDIEGNLRNLAALETCRREHVQTIMTLLNRKAEAIRTAQADLQRDLDTVRSKLLDGNSLEALVDALGSSREKIDLRMIESVVRGVLLTEEQREYGFSVDTKTSSDLTLDGLPLSCYFGIGQIIHTKLEALDTLDYYRNAYNDLESLINDLRAPLRDEAKHAQLKSYLGRPPKKVLPVGESDLRLLLDQPKKFEQYQSLIGALVVRYGGMTCHTAVISRGMSIPCIQLGGGFLQLKKYQFAAIQNGKALLFQTPPDELHRFL